MSVNGSFAPSPFSSLSVRSPENVTVGFLSGETIPVQLTNHTGHLKIYHWNATQKGALISLGEETLKSGSTTTINVPSRGAAAGTLRIALNGSNVFVTVPILKS
jgi:hypothetical protein